MVLEQVSDQGRVRNASVSSPLSGMGLVYPTRDSTLTLREQERMTQEAWEAVRRHRCYRLPILLSFLAVGPVMLGLLLNVSTLIHLLLVLFSLVQWVAWFGVIVWQRRLFRKALWQKLLDADIRPRICFECGYNMEGYEGKECPACDVPLLRQPDSTQPMS